MGEATFKEALMVSLYEMTLSVKPAKYVERVIEDTLKNNAELFTSLENYDKKLKVET